MMFCTYPNIFVGQESLFGAEPVLRLLCRFLEHLATSTATAGVRQVTKTISSFNKTNTTGTQSWLRGMIMERLTKRTDNREVG